MELKMNDSLYEDYMRSVLGYQPMNNYQDTYNYNSYDNYSNYDVVPTMAPMQTQGMQMMNMQSMSARPMTAMNNIQIQELEKCYPEIYQKVDFKVDSMCDEIIWNLFLIIDKNKCFYKIIMEIKNAIR